MSCEVAQTAGRFAYPIATASKVMIPMAAFDELVEPDELRYELDEGELVVFTRPRTFHNDIAGNLFYSLKHYL